MKKFNKDKLYPIFTIVFLLMIWEGVVYFEIVPKYMLPGPLDVIKAIYVDRSKLVIHFYYTLYEALVGLFFGVIIGFFIASIMDRFDGVNKALYPIVIVSQTIPTVAIAPLLVLWLGYETLPKVVLIIIGTFFPITIGLLEGYASADQDAINLLKAMGASKMQIFRHIKFPGALSHFFSGLKISCTYSIVGAVISEWLGGFYGLGVYMTRVRKSYAFDKMFGVIFIISIMSLILMKIVDVLQKKLTPWEVKNEE